MKRLVLLVSVGLAACGGGRDSPSPSPERPEVTITGFYYATDVTDTCGSYRDLVSRQQIVFKDGQGVVIDATETSELLDVENVVGPSPSELFPGSYSACREWSEYQATLPQADFYQAEVNGQAVGTIAYQDLQAAGFKWDLELPPE